MLLPYLSHGTGGKRYVLIDRLKYYGYTEDPLGKRTEEMTLPELEQTFINLEYKREKAWKT
ncbi:hypothetical protein [Halobacillus sp. KGW1]|uniref:hypothetical protein n=1 Tax=Halobacillus sp. KGW1 TaxID=1793726 RepID=UPI000781B5A3|nr:hypothetical protein [Halobacillus sp. KGW1]